MATGSRLTWIINDIPFIFFGSSKIYANEHANGFVVTLLNKSTQGVQFEFTSVLTILHSNVSVECVSDSPDTVETEHYHIEVEGKCMYTLYMIKWPPHTSVIQISLAQSH